VELLLSQATNMEAFPEVLTEEYILLRQLWEDHMTTRGISTITELTKNLPVAKYIAIGL
jgi:hypothetical protein